MKETQKLVVLIPAFNEEKTIAAVINAIPRKIQGIEKTLVLIVDDGSTDKTVQKAKNAGADKIVSHKGNKGLGMAFQTGLDTALKMGAGIIVNIDADGQFNPKDIPKLVKPILQGKADVVTCSRFLDKKLEPKMPSVKRFGNRLFTKIINLFTGSSFTDTQCGFRAYSREAALRTNLFARFTYTQEVLMDLSQKGMRIEEVACKVEGERKGKSRVVKHWYIYGIRAMMIIIRTLRDYKPLQFFGSIGILMAGFGVIQAFYLWMESQFPQNPAVPAWLVNLDVLLIVVGLLLLVLALLADLIDRQKRIQEEILYRIKRKETEKNDIS